MLVKISSAVLVQPNGLGSFWWPVSLDGFFELGDRAEHASFQGALGQQREEAFDLIDP